MSVFPPSASSIASASRDPRGPSVPSASSGSNGSRAPRPPSPRVLRPQTKWENLFFYQKTDVLYQLTVAFCRRFLPKFGDRTVDQMMTTHLKKKEADFVENGGIKERMTAARLGRRRTQNAEIAALRAEATALQAENTALQAELASLRERLGLPQAGRSSPPSASSGPSAPSCPSSSSPLDFLP